MGSISKSPKAPRAIQPSVVYVPQAVAAPVTTSASAPEDTQTEPSEEEQRTELRRKNLLRRNRGKLGTVLTGFRGVLGRVNDSGHQKTLLGE